MVEAFIHCETSRSTEASLGRRGRCSSSLRSARRKAPRTGTISSLLARAPVTMVSAHARIKLLAGACAGHVGQVVNVKHGWYRVRLEVRVAHATTSLLWRHVPP